MLNQNTEYKLTNSNSFSNTLSNTDLTVGFAGTTITTPATYNELTYTSSNPWYDHWMAQEHSLLKYWKIYRETMYNPKYVVGIDVGIEETNKEIKMSDSKNKTVDLFDDKSEEQKLLEEYGIVNECGDVTDTGLQVLLKLMLAEKRTVIVDKLKADKDSKKKLKS
jgi:hypothetical protein